MATFEVYAEVLTPDNPLMKMFRAGVKKNLPGETLQDVLRRSGGEYKTSTPMPSKVRERILQVAELTADKRLRAIAELDEIPVSLEHLRDVDPQTRILVGGRLELAPGESQRLGWGLKGSPDPRRSILVDDE